MRFVMITSVLVLLLTYPVTGFDYCRRNTTGLKLIKNGYEEIIVWIGEEVIEDYSMVRDLQQLLQNTSTQLYISTKRRAYFRHVSIFLPSTWGHPPDDLHDIVHTSTFPATESPARAHFWVRNRTPRSAVDSLRSWKRGDQTAVVPPPYVIKTTPCGFPGKYIRLSSEFIKFGEKVVDSLGEPGKRVTREFAKLRWGVYDEVPAEALSPGHFYLHTDLTAKPIACSLNLKGNAVNNPKYSTKCNKDRPMNDQSCLFEPHKELSDQQKAPRSSKTSFASIMHSSKLSYVDQFCDTKQESGEAVAPEHEHNSEAPTIHNLHCNGKSTWEVMREHEDFRDGNNPPMEGDLPPPIQFKLIEKPDRRVVLLIDTSTSMRSFNRLELMRQAASHFIDIVPDNTWVGIVCFSSRAVVKETLIEITQIDVRDLLKRRIPKRLIAGTSIGSGIKKAMEVLQTSGPKHMQGSGGSILVLTDGKEHNRPKINDTISAVRAYGVRVSTIAFGPNVAKDLEYLADISGGQTYFASSGEFSQSNELRESFTASVETNEENMVIVGSDKLQIGGNETARYEFFIDDTIGLETRITVLYRDSIDPIVGIKTPMFEISEIDGREKFTAQGMTFFIRVEKEFFKKMIYIPGEIPVGTWALIIKNRKAVTSIDVQVSVISQARKKNEDTLELSPALLCRTIDYTGVEAVVIYAHVSIGELAVLSARVIAEVTRPLTSAGMVDTSVLQLWDNGFGADVIPDDGVYSGYFRAFTLKGRYSVKVYADNPDGRARVTTKNILGIGVMDIDFPVVNTRYLITNETEKPEKDESEKRRKRALFDGFLPAFQRTSSGAGAFTVNTWDADGKICPAGYEHFQDSCYKIFRTQFMSNVQANDVCGMDRGYLANIGTYQELRWIRNKVGNRQVWFGGITEDLRQDETLEEHLKDHTGNDKDEDLWALTALMNRTAIPPEQADAVETFAPDWVGLSQKEVNSIAKFIGSPATDVESLTKEIQNVQQSHQKINRTRREVDLGSGALEDPLAVLFGEAFTTGGILATDDIPSSSTEYSSTTIHQTSTTAPVTHGDGTTAPVTLSPAKREPKKPVPDEETPEASCSWFQDAHLIRSEGEICKGKKIFICEREKIDLTPPSRVINLREKSTDNNRADLTWTAPGDDLMEGTVSSYEFRTLRTKGALNQLNDNFLSGQIIEEKHIINSSLDVLGAAGSNEYISIDLDAVAGCPPHVAIDLFIIIPEKSLKKDEELLAVKEMIESVADSVIIDAYEVTVSIITMGSGKGHILLRQSETLAEITSVLSADNADKISQTSDDMGTLLGTLHQQGRKLVPKIVIVIADSRKYLLNYTTSTQATVLLISVGSWADIRELYDAVSEPQCTNSLIVEDWASLTRSATNIVQQMCYFRSDEYQAIGFVAIDNDGNRSPPSHIVPILVSNNRDEIDCAPLPETSQPLAQAGLSTVETIAAVTIPIVAILCIVGVIILFGQVRKYKRKRAKRKEEKLRAEQEAARAERLKNDPRMESIRNKLKNSPQKMRFQRSNKTAPLNNPPV